MYRVKIKTCREHAVIPTRSTDGSAGYDVKSPCEYVVRYGRQVIPAGLQTSFTHKIRLDSRPKSGYSLKGFPVVDRWGRRWRIDADVELGLIDSDYRGEIGTILHVRSLLVLLLGWLFRFRIERGQQLAQLCFSIVPHTEFVLVDDLPDTDRGHRGFGAVDDDSKSQPGK